MARGIKLPMGTDKGRLALLGGDDYIAQCVFAMLGDSESTNPWQEIGLGEFMIFDINDTSTEGEIRTALVQGFEILERDQLAKLDDPHEDLVFDTDTGRYGSDKKVTVTYTNMETQERREIEVPLYPAT